MHLPAFRVTLGDNEKFICPAKPVDVEKHLSIFIRPGGGQFVIRRTITSHKQHICIESARQSYLQHGNSIRAPNESRKLEWRGPG